MSLQVLAPLAGTVVAMADVPDPVFADSIVGPGLAIDPGTGPGTQAVSPVAGTIVKLHPHAFVVLAESGTGVLVHLGLDTVQLAGEGFTLLVAEGASVTAGQPLVAWDPQQVAAGGRSPVSPVVVLDADADALTFAGEPGARVAAGDALFTVR